MIKRLIALLALACALVLLAMPILALAAEAIVPAGESPPDLVGVLVEAPNLAPLPARFTNYALRCPERNPLLEYQRARIQPRPALLE